MAEQLKVMISSTARDLPEHRKEVMDGCLRQGMFPSMMEHLPANDFEAISASLKLVDEAEIYVGVFAHRYGYVPRQNNPQQISVTEMEYNRAVDRKIPRLIFVMDKTHPITIDDVEQGVSADKLKAFKERVQTDNIVNFFSSPTDLRAHVISSLSQLRKPDLQTFHYVSDIPPPPEVFIAHPYTLLQTHRLIGRQAELKLLTDWITGKELEFDSHKAPADSVRIMSVVAIGGMGKSALTWKWFNEVAPQEMKALAGRMWWSFYESDATFENFVARALAYTRELPLDEVLNIPAPERETQLLAALDRQPFLLVLDGLERILIAYARMDAGRLDDSEVGKEKSLRKTADPRVGRFLQKLAQVKQSRVLVSSRLYPAELETSGGDPTPGSFRIRIEGLIDEDAVELWRAFGVSGSRDDVLPIFNTFAKHPLLIQALAGEVKRYRKAPGNFEAWCKANPNFDPGKFSKTKEAMAHVLEFALRGLQSKAQQALQTIAAFRMPTSYDTLAAISVGETKPCASEPELDGVLNELEDRGLLGWDKRANRYDLHPIVRGVVWLDLGDDARRVVYTSLHAYFEAVPTISSFEVKSLEDLTSAIELYYTLIGLGRYDHAYAVFRDALSDAMLYRLSASRQRAELIELLFPEGLDQPPRVTRKSAQGYTLNALAQAYQLSGKPGRATGLFRRHNTIRCELKDDNNLSAGLSNLSETLRLSGALCESDITARSALVITREQDNRFQEAVSLRWLGSTLATRGLSIGSESALLRSLRLFRAGSNPQGEGVNNCYLVPRALWLGEFEDALSFANNGWELAHVQSFERDFIRAARAQGEAALGLNDLATADERLHHALMRALKVNLVEEELTALGALAELRWRQKDMKAARELLNDVWEPAERGPYPLIHSDACNVLAQIERDEGNTAAAIEAATKAYRLAWCDGPPFAYHWGLEKAKQHLKELSAPEPEMPPFDESKFEPMPEVEIDPHDEFHVDAESSP